MWMVILTTNESNQYIYAVSGNASIPCPHQKNAVDVLYTFVEMFCEYKT